MSRVKETPEPVPMEKTAIVPRAVPTGPPAPTDPPHLWPTSLDIRTPEGQRDIVKMSGPPAKNWQQAADTEYVIVGYLLRPAEHEDEETGEVSQYTQLTLLTDSGATIGTPGSVAIRKWLMILHLCGSPSADNSIKIRALRVASRRQGRTYDDLELMPPF